MNTREYLRANLFDGDEGGVLTSPTATFLSELTEVVDELIEARMAELERAANKAFANIRRSFVGTPPNVDAEDAWAAGRIEKAEEIFRRALLRPESEEADRG